MNRKSLRELIKILKFKENEIKRNIEMIKDNDNPQVRDIYMRLKGELKMLEAVLEYAELGTKHLF